METTRMLAILVLALGLTVCAAVPSQAVPIGTAFTYQGRLIDANDTADGEYDFQFKLFDANVAGTQQESTIDVNELDLIDGYFTVKLDFNEPNLFIGEALWLEISVRPGNLNEPNVYTILKPRQELTPTPFSHYARYSYYAQGAGTDNDWEISGNDMYSLPSGNVGIGTSGPGDKLDVDGHINASESYKLDGDTILSNKGSYSTFVGKDAGLSNSGASNSALGSTALYSNAGGQWNTALGSGALYSNTTGRDNSAVGRGSLYSNITGRGNVAMGIAALYDVSAGHHNVAVGYRAGHETTGSGNVFLGWQAGYYETGSNKLYIANSDANPPLIYGDFSTTRVGIGTKTPQGTLDVHSGGTQTDALFVRSSPSVVHQGGLIHHQGGTYAWQEATDNTSNSSLGGLTFNFVRRTAPNTKTRSDVLVLRGNGKVGIGVVVPQEVLDVNGTGRFRKISAGLGTPVVADGNGKLWKSGPSSKRYKTNIKALEINPNAVLELRPVSFQYKSSGHQDIGLIAEEVEELLEDLVIYDSQGKPDAVKYDKVALYLCAALKAQQEKIAALEKRLEVLENTTEQPSKGKELEL